jgi:single-stranded-DNA-specific exonuclease
MGPEWLPRRKLDSLNAQGALEKYPELIGRLLLSRGFDDSGKNKNDLGIEDVDSFLFPKLTEIADPLKLKGLSLAIQRMMEAFEKNEKICIYADFDLDGSSGLALLWFGLKGLGYSQVLYKQPKRLSEGYGFHSHIVEELKQQGVSLIVTVDVGITAVEACKKAQELGIDVIITDHHLPSEEYPPAYVIVNPNQKDCTSGLGYLSGAGVAFYLLRALKRSFYEKGLGQNFDLMSVLDFFTIATITDMVPLVKDNRVLVKRGLVSIQKSVRPGMIALMDRLGMLGMDLSAQDVALKLAPKLNALSRMEMGLLPVDLYLVEDSLAAEKMVDVILENNSQRVDVQAKAEWESLEILKDWPHSHFIFLASEIFHKGVVGLVATKLTQLKNCPVFIGSQNSEGIITGSARIPQGSGIHLVNALESASAHLNRFGGHAAAAGFELKQENIEAVIQSLCEYFEGAALQTSLPPVHFDTVAKLADINADSMGWFTALGPFGSGFEIPLICLEKIYIKSLKDLKGGHFRMQLEQNNDVAVALLFSPSQKQRDLIQQAMVHQDVADYPYLDFLCEMQWNYFNGRKTVQLLVREVRCCLNQNISLTNINETSSSENIVEI